MFGWTKRCARGGLDRRAVLEVRRQRLHQGAAGAEQREVDLVDEVATGVAVAGEGPLGQQVALRTGRGASGQPLAARWADSAARAEAWAWPRSAVTGPDHDGPVAEVVDDPGRGLGADR